jgi:glucose-6-phosphate isomerase, archaeal
VPAPTAQMNVNLSSGELLRRGIQCLSRTIEDLKGVYRDEESCGLLDQKTVVYRTEAFHPVDEGNEGALFWGTTFLNPGMVGTSTA